MEINEYNVEPKHMKAHYIALKAFGIHEITYMYQHICINILAHGVIMRNVYSVLDFYRKASQQQQQQ